MCYGHLTNKPVYIQRNAPRKIVLLVTKRDVTLVIEVAKSELVNAFIRSIDNRLSVSASPRYLDNFRSGDVRPGNHMRHILSSRLN
jgi:hypothetical protein